jgi:hypothetical protein
VYAATLPSRTISGQDFEYYVEAAPAEGSPVRFPVTAPALSQTVVVMAASLPATGP